MNDDSPAILSFADGVIFEGTHAGYPAAAAVGEAVFNTAICGYQEIISDPSYHRQIINFTHPHIGNTGTNSDDDESPQAFAAGIVVRKISAAASSWRAKQNLADYLTARCIPAISGIDTRAVTRKLRDGGAMAACIACGNDEKTRQQAIAAAAAFAGLGGAMLAAEASGLIPPQWRGGLWNAADNQYGMPAAASDALRVCVLDCGVKAAILRELAGRGLAVSVLPYDSDLAAVLQTHPDGVLFSNGPGDPEPCDEALHLARQLLAQKIPILGICLGHQIVAAALGAKIIKMKFGHHGANHPVRATKDGRVYITSQNHGFAIDANTLPPSVRATHVSLFDGSLQGLAADEPPVLTFQGHPEASPGPRDAVVLFDDFVQMMHTHR